MADAPHIRHSMLQSKFPVSVPEMPELKLAKDDFTAYIQSMGTTGLDNIRKLSVYNPGQAGGDDKKAEVEAPKSSFLEALLLDKKLVPSFDERDGKMLTDNADVAHRTSGSALVDLFYELEEVVGEEVLQKRLEEAWAEGADATLKIIWNARSIHLGKSSRHCFYRAVGWLYEEYPVTLLTNLQWLVRPLIRKKVPRKGKTAPEDDVVQADYDSDLADDVDAADDVQGSSKKRKISEVEADAEFDIKYGVAHGYWKDLLNILVLAVHDELKVGGAPRSILNTEKPNEKKYKRDWTEGRKRKSIKERHEATEQKLREDPKYKALHLCIARLFAEQLKLDLARLESNNKTEMKKVTLAGKWAPSNKGMHDQHTTIVSSIAELLHPRDSVCPDADPSDRDLYLKHARNAYQVKTLSKLRKHLDVVERNITAKTFEQIHYDRVPSLAMKQHVSTFAKKDFDRFDSYLDSVAKGKARISGAVLLPSTLVSAACGGRYSGRRHKTATDQLVEQKLHDIAAKAANGQWGTLVQRVKDSGTLESSIAVCDTSGSMGGPTFPDGTCPMDSSIGLSLLIAEVAKPPFGGCFITFNAVPQVMRVGGGHDLRSFAEKVRYIESAPWGMNTDFVAVFEKLILPRAVENKVSPEDMVKQVFVFSDMQFDQASDREDRWATSYERVQELYREHGYEMPKLVFWNLAGGRAGYDETAPKPVTAAEEGKALVSGYSQAQLKMFLDGGQFQDEETIETIETKDLGHVQDDALATVRKAISHDAYRMLKVESTWVRL